VLEHVAEDQAVERARLDRREVVLDVEDEDVVEPGPGRLGGGGVQLHAGDVAPRVLAFELMPEAAPGAADLKDPPGRRRHGREQVLVEAVVVEAGLRLREHGPLGVSRS